MVIYPREEKIKDKIVANTTANAVVEVIEQNRVEAKLQQNTENINKLITFLRNGTSTNGTVMWQPAILVSTDWNKNDDVFTAEETFAARNTPFLQAVNWNHQGDEDNNECIGVINNVACIDDNYNIIDQPIDKFHIAIGMTVWKSRFPTYAENIADSSSDNKLFVSMECIFSDFGYALKRENDPENTTVLVPRNENTAWLSEKLRAYGGDGKVEIKGKTFRVGRWLKSITFDGVGYVYNPANPESIIIKAAASNKYEIISENNIDNFYENLENSVLINAQEAKGTIMPNDNDVKTEQKAEACPMDNQEMQKMQAMIDNLQAELTASKNQCAALQASLTEKETKLAEANKTMTDAIAKLDEINKNATAHNRLETIKEFIDITDEAKTFAELKEMSNEAFAIALNYAKAGSTKKVPEVKDDAKADDNVAKLTDAVKNADTNVGSDLNKAAASVNDTDTYTALAQKLIELSQETGKNRKGK